MYPQLMTAACNAQLGYEDKPGREPRSDQCRLRGMITTIMEHIMQFRVGTISDNPGNQAAEIKKKFNKTRGNGNSSKCHKNVIVVMLSTFQCKGWGHVVWECPSIPLNKKMGKVVNTSDLPPGMCNQMDENQECQ